MNLLVVRLTALGDVVLSSVVLGALRAHFQDAAIDLCTSPAYAPLFTGHPALREVLPLARGASVWGAARALRSRRYDAVIDLQHKVRTGVFARLLGARQRVVFVKRRGRELWRSLAGKPLRPGAHTAELYLRALAPLGVPMPAPGTARLFVPVQPQARLAVDGWLAQARLGPGAFVALAPGAAHATKRWPLASFVALAERVRAAGLVPVGVGGPPDAQALDALAAAGVCVAPAAWPLTELAALLARARALVCGDTGPAHLAAAVGTPVVSVFGPTDPVRWSPYGVPHRVVTRGLVCAPCSDHGGPVCPLGTHACLAVLGADEVAGALASLLAETASVRA